MDEQMSVDLQGELLADLTSELEAEPTFSSTKLFQKVVGAIREVKRARKYPSYYTETQIRLDLYGFYSETSISHICRFVKRFVGNSYILLATFSSISRNPCSNSALKCSNCVSGFPREFILIYSSSVSPISLIGRK